MAKVAAVGVGDVQDAFPVGPGTRYLAIASAGVADALIPLLEARSDQNLSSAFVALESILASTPGTTTASRVQRYLRGLLKDGALEYLLLVGTSTTLPPEYFYPKAGSVLDSNTTPGRVPSFIGYADPDLMWDANANGLPGEFGTDAVPLFEARLAVGIIPFDDVESIRQVVRQTLAFERRPLVERLRFLGIGAMLGYGGEPYGNGTISRMDGMTLPQFIVREVLGKRPFSVRLLGETEGLLPSTLDFDVPLTAESVADALQDGFGLICWNAHGTAQGVSRAVWEADENGDGIPNDGYVWSEFVGSATPTAVNGGIVLAGSCLTSQPEADNLGAAFLLKGATAYIGATRISWSPSSWRGLDDGGMNSIYAKTADALVRGESVGVAMYEALAWYRQNAFYADREDPVEAAQNNLFDFCVYGDPAVRLIRPDDALDGSIGLRSDTSVLYAGERGSIMVYHAGFGNNAAPVVEGMPESVHVTWQAMDGGSGFLLCDVDPGAAAFAGTVRIRMGEGPSAVATTLELRIDPARFSALALEGTIGGDGSASVVVRSARPLSVTSEGFGFEVEFDPDAVQLVSVAENVSRNGTRDGTARLVQDATAGRISVRVAGSGFIENGPLCTLMLRVRELRSTVVRVTGMTGDLSGCLPVDVRLEPAETVWPWTDVNLDGTVDAADVELVTGLLGRADAWEEDANAGDVNRDGRVDGDDLLLTAAVGEGMPVDVAAPTVQSSVPVTVAAPAGVAVDGFLELVLAPQDATLAWGLSANVRYDASRLSLESCTSAESDVIVRWTRPEQGLLSIAAMAEGARTASVVLRFSPVTPGMTSIAVYGMTTRSRSAGGRRGFQIENRVAVFPTGQPGARILVAGPLDRVVMEGDAVVVGAVDPGTVVTCNGEPVYTGADGAFWHRQAVRQGAQELTFRIGSHAEEVWLTVRVMYRESAFLELKQTDGMTVAAPLVILVGRTDPGSAVAVNGSRLDVLPDGSFSDPVRLNPGANVLRVAVVRLDGISVTRRLTIRWNPSILLSDGDTLCLVGAERHMLARAPFMYRGYLYVPVRAVAEALGATVSWNSILGEASIRLGDRMVEMTLGMSGIKANGHRTPAVGAYTQAPVMVMGSLYVPGQSLLGGLGLSLRWNPDSRQLWAGLT
ncbi:MAG: C25 family cysteine peptidase [Caldisericota bacterium]|nr:C25 family cysteine peptidase [Caldisericota bacterium]